MLNVCVFRYKLYFISYYQGRGDSSFFNEFSSRLVSPPFEIKLTIDILIKIYCIRGGFVRMCVCG